MPKESKSEGSMVQRVGSKGEMQYLSFQERQLVFYFYQPQYYMIQITHTFVCEGVWGYSTHFWALF